jgi:hypothetical protein
MVAWGAAAVGVQLLDQADASNFWAMSKQLKLYLNFSKILRCGMTKMVGCTAASVAAFPYP